jgi:hypothetical protein
VEKVYLVMGLICMACIRFGRRVRSARGSDHMEQIGVKQALEKMGIIRRLTLHRSIALSNHPLGLCMVVGQTHRP